MEMESPISGPPPGELKGRRLKQEVERLLETDPFAPALERLLQFPPRRVINPLFSFLYSGRPRVRWRAVSAMGRVVARQAEGDLPAARIVMRRLMWNLNDESGGMGWGSPEAMGEILARSRPLAREYHHILLSYLDPGGNFLEHEGLQQGALWGAGRLFYARPELGAHRHRLLRPFLAVSDAARRGLAAWAAVPLAAEALRGALVPLVADPSVVQVYDGMSLAEKRIGDLALEALQNLEKAR